MHRELCTAGAAGYLYKKKKRGFLNSLQRWQKQYFSLPQHESALYLFDTLADAERGLHRESLLLQMFDGFRDPYQPNLVAYDEFIAEMRCPWPAPNSSDHGSSSASGLHVEKKN